MFRRFIYVVFCVSGTGIKFALAQTKAGLAAIVRDFKITVSPKQKPFVMDIRAFLYQARDGLMVNFTPRSSA